MIHQKKWTLLICLQLVSYAGLSQCPLDINGATTAPSENLLLYLPLDGSISNQGTGSYTFTKSGATFINAVKDQGLLLDGIDDYIEVTPSLNLVDDFTISTWIIPYAQDNPMGILSVRDQCTSNYRGNSIAEFTINGYSVPGLNYLVNTQRSCSGYSRGDRYTNATISLLNRQPVLVSLTVQNNQSEDRVIKLYVNCETYESETVMDFPTEYLFNSSINFTTTIGASSNVAGFINSFHGVIDEMRVYDRVLDRMEIMNIYHNSMPLAIAVTSYPDCDSDSAAITLSNAQADVMYQLKNITTNTLIDGIQYGNCDDLTFNTPSVADTTSFQIIATHQLSGCTRTLDTTIVLSPTFFSASQENEVNTRNDTTLCLGETITLDSSLPNASYLWQDGSTESAYRVTQPGVYWVTAENDCLTTSDTVSVNFADCNCSIYFPNAFTPNSDFLNDTFQPSSACRLSTYQLRIYNRWGELVFATESVDDFWDGYYQGGICQTGTYTWRLLYAVQGSEDHYLEKSGSVHLLR